MTEIETRRLRMRPFEPGDLERLAALHADPAVMAQMKDGVQTRDEARAELARYVRTWADHGFGIWALFDKASGAFVGECGLRLRDDDAGVGLRCALRPAWWSRGLAGEAGRAALAFAFETAGLERVVAVAKAASCRALEKAGLRRQREFRNRGTALVLYAVTRAEWRARGQDGAGPIPAPAAPTRRSTS